MGRISMIARGMGMGGRRRGNREKGPRDGFTLVETALATTVLMIALMSASVATLRMHSLRRQNREKVLAQNALRSVAEQIHSVSGSMQGAEDMQDWIDAVMDTFGPGGTVGTTFAVPELTAQGQDDDAEVGAITLFTNETATDAAIGFEMGLPRDLNGDGLINDPDVTDGVGDPGRILPVLLTVRWRGVSGLQRMDHAFYVLGY